MPDGCWLQVTEGPLLLGDFYTLRLRTGVLCGWVQDTQLGYRAECLPLFEVYRPA